MDFSTEGQAMASDHANGIGMESHMDMDVLGFHISTSLIHYFEGNIQYSVPSFKTNPLGFSEGEQVAETLIDLVSQGW